MSLSGELDMGSIHFVMRSQMAILLSAFRFCTVAQASMSFLQRGPIYSTMVSSHILTGPFRPLLLEPRFPRWRVSTIIAVHHDLGLSLLWSATILPFATKFDFSRHACLSVAAMVFLQSGVPSVLWNHVMIFRPVLVL